MASGLFYSQREMTGMAIGKGSKPTAADFGKKPVPGVVKPNKGETAKGPKAPKPRAMFA